MTFNTEETITISNIHTSTTLLTQEIINGRLAAHNKHGENSIENIPGYNTGKWLPILGEEFGEVCESLTYDKFSYNLRNELIDVITVATAWVAAIDWEA